VGGFVGHHLLEYFDKTENPPAEIMGIDYRAAEIEFIPKRFSCRFESADLMNRKILEQYLSDFQPDSLIHLAAVSSVAASWQDPAGCISNNISILLHLLESVRKCGLKCRILVIGSSEVYDLLLNDFELLNEKSPLCPNNPYAVGRLAQENLVRIYTNVYGLDIVSTRSFSHTGPGQSDRFVIASFLRQLLHAQQNGSKTATLKTGNVDLIRDFSDVRDVVNAYHLLLERGRTGEIYNVCSGNGISLRDVIKLASQILNLETTIEMDSSRLRPTDVPKVIGNPEKLRRETGWTPQFSLEQTIRDMIQF
jgi:GDP-4-dehydro-6-deoxy-D-mannose reductase